MAGPPINLPVSEGSQSAETWFNFGSSAAFFMHPEHGKKGVFWETVE
jgi:hypothetical protein